MDFTCLEKLQKKVKKSKKKQDGSLKFKAEIHFYYKNIGREQNVFYFIS